MPDSWAVAGAQHNAPPMGWAACFSFQFAPPTYHLFLSDERSACRRLRADQALTPFFADMPGDGLSCSDCRKRLERPGLGQRRADIEPPDLAAVPLFAGRARPHHIMVRRL